MARITELRTLLLATPLAVASDLPTGTWTRRQNLIAIVETSDGVRGLGEVWVNFPAWGCADRVAVVREAIRPLLLGETLDDPARLHAKLWQKLRPLASRWAAPGPVSHAISGVDIALWDAASRAAGKPLREFIAGGKRPDTLPVYASGIGPGAPGPLIERAASWGHTHFKLRLVEGPERDRRMLREGRAAAGTRTLMADPAETYTLSSIRAIWDDVVAARLDWLEEPFPVWGPDYQTYRTLPEAPPLALGESTYGLAGFEALLRDPAPDVVQPDITKTGGISEGRALVRMAVAAGRRLCLHMLAGPVGLVASCNLMAAHDGVHRMEVDADPVPTYEPMLGAPLRFEAGAMRLSARPGLGIELDEAALREWIVAA